MRLYELVDSDQQLIGLIKPILLRAKAEGANTISMSQLLNDIDDKNSITPELIVDVLNRQRNYLKDIISSASVSSIELNRSQSKSMSSDFDKQISKLKNVARKQALDQLK